MNPSRFGASYDPNFPATISNAQAWWDFSDLSTITKDGSDRVSQVNDKIGSWNLTQGTGGSQPLWLSANKNGLDVIDTVGSRWLENTHTTIGGSNCICSAMYYPDENLAPLRQMFWNTNDYTNRMMAESQGTVGSFGMYSGTAIGFSGAAALGNAWHYTDMQYGASARWSVDGTDKVTGNSGTQNPDSIRISVDSDGINYFGNTKFGEIIYIDGTLSAGDTTSMRSYLAAKWGI